MFDVDFRVVPNGMRGEFDVEELSMNLEMFEVGNGSKLEVFEGFM